jgi:hypothetical protein
MTGMESRTGSCSSSCSCSGVRAGVSGRFTKWLHGDLSRLPPRARRFDTAQQEQQLTFGPARRTGLRCSCAMAPTMNHHRGSRLPGLAVAAGVALASCGTARAHLRHFPGHPEWDDIWPDPLSLNDLRNSDGLSAGDVPPDLSGVWRGSPLASDDARYFMTPSGGGYGSSKDRSFANEAPAPPGMAFDVRCVTGDFQAQGDQPCGWDKARAMLSGSAGNWTATLTFYDGGVVSVTYVGVLREQKGALCASLRHAGGRDGPY